MKYGIVLLEKPCTHGLNKDEVIQLINLVDTNICDEFYPIEIEAKRVECSAMGFIREDVAEHLDYNYDESGLNDFISLILDDMNREREDCHYTFRGIDIYLSR